jgi:RNA polymerase sigma factor (TIGR02999 family)
MTRQPSVHEITDLLLAWGNGKQAALDELIPLVYMKLHRMAKRYMARENPGHILQPTALINEAFLQMIDGEKIRWQNRAHFFGVAAKIMRNVVVDIARSNRNLKRGGKLKRISLDESLIVSQARSAELLALDDALKTLAALNLRHSAVVELRFFGGLSYEEIAEVLKVSVGTVRGDWSMARAWLYNQLNRKTGNDT